MAANDLGRLVARLEADASRFNRELRVASKELRGFETRTERTSRNVRRGLDRMFEGAGRVTRSVFSLRGAAVAAAGGAGLGLLFKRSVDTAAQLQRQAETTDISVEGMQRLQVAAERLGAPTGELNQALTELGIRAGEAAAGEGEMRSTLENLNPELLRQLTATQSLEEQFLLVVDAISEAESQQERMTLASAAFSDQGAEKLLTALQSGRGAWARFGREAERTGQIMDSSVTPQAVETQREIDSLARTFRVQFTEAILGAQDPTRTLLEELSDPETVDKVEGLADRTASLARSVVELGLSIDKHGSEISDFFESASGGFFEPGSGAGITGIGFEGMPSDLQEFLTGVPPGRERRAAGVREELNLTERRLSSLESGGLEFHEVEIAQELRERRSRLQEELERLEREGAQVSETRALELLGGEGLAAAGQPRPSAGGARGGGGGAASGGGATRDEPARLFEDPEVPAFFDTPQMRFDALRQASEERLRTLEREADRRSSLAEEITQRHREATGTRAELIRAEAERWREKTRTLVAEGEERQQLLAKINESEEARLEEIGDDGEGTFSGLSRGVDLFGRTAGRVFGDLLTGAEVSFESMAESFIRSLARMQAQALATDLQSAITGEEGGGQSSLVVDLLGMAVSGIGGAVSGGGGALAGASFSSGSVNPVTGAVTTGGAAGITGLAEGAVVEPPGGVFNVGEGGEAEVVSPVSDLLDAISEGGGGDVEVNIYEAPSQPKVSRQSLPGGGTRLDVEFDAMTAQAVARGPRTNEALSGRGLPRRGTRRG